LKRFSQRQSEYLRLPPPEANLWNFESCAVVVHVVVEVPVDVTATATVVVEITRGELHQMTQLG
jgi:hypothetical protein